MKRTGKLDVVNVVKKSSREMFAGIDTRTKSVPSKKRYVRKQKHSGRVDH